MRTKHRTRGRAAAAAVAAFLALVAIGCGDDDASDTATTAATSTASTAPTTAPTTAVASETTTSTTQPLSTESSSTEPATTEPDDVTVQVFFSVGDGSDCTQVEAFDRVTASDDPIQAAFVELVGGPTREEAAAGAGSFFSAETAGMVSSVTLADGLLVVDFVDARSLLPNASTSCGSAALLAQLDNTAFQFPAVERVRYRIEGSCDEFANWLQRECFDSDRGGQQLDVPTNERASGSGCTPPSGEGLPDGRWFGFVEAADGGLLSFDLACWFVGTAAGAAAAEDGEESPPPNDYHVRNANNRVRILPVTPTAEVAWLPEPGNPESLAIVVYDDWRAQRNERLYQPGVWINIDGGAIISIEEQFVP